MGGPDHSSQRARRLVRLAARGLAATAALLAAGTALAGKPATTKPSQSAPPAPADDAWTRMMAELAPMAGEITAHTLDPADPNLRAQVEWQLLSGIAQYLVNYRSQDPNFPKFTPFGNEVVNFNNVPDYMFRVARVEGTGNYRISGFRGTSRFVEIQQMVGLDETSAPARKLLSRFELDDFRIGPDGAFSVILSPTRPAGYTGDWVQLDPAATSLLVREAAYDWANEVDARMAIVRLDPPSPAPQITPRIVDAHLATIPGWIRDRAGQWVKYLTAMRDKGQINTLTPVTFTGGVQGQAYYETVFDIAPDEALILETEVPKTCRYWGVLITNETYMTVDWTRYHSSLNGGQARLDKDGRFRAVISATDPGVANWVETGHNRKGIVQFRWSRCSSTPLPVLTKVPLAEVDRHLPADTARLTPDQRLAETIERRASAQLRRRW